MYGYLSGLAGLFMHVMHALCGYFYWADGVIISVSGVGSVSDGGGGHGGCGDRGVSSDPLWVPIHSV
jgi:hypothetical protein